MTPNILKNQKTYGEPLDQGNVNMDGDHSAKTMEQGANAATKGATDMADGVHEGVKQTVRFLVET